jgi:VIT1/CCC1 family predicted Fe2+/Mn2+ transporter
MEEAELEMEWRELLRRPDEERAELISTFRHDGYQLEEAETMADRLMDDRQLALRFMAERELGIASEAPTDPRKDAAVMAGSYVVGGLLPLIPYVLFADLLAIVASIALTILALGAVGVIKARTAHRPVFTSVLEVVGIGAAAGALGYALGEWLPRLFGIG